MEKQNSLKFLNRGISTPVGILIILICALLLGGILFLQWSGLQKIKPPEIKTLEEILPPPPPEEELSEEIIPEDETADWKIYRNEELGISFKYPKEWKLEECMKFIKGGGFGASAQSISDCNVWTDFVDEYFFYKLTPGISLENYFSKRPPIFYFYQDSGFIDYSKTKITMEQEGIILDGYMCYHEACPSVGPCGDVPPLAYCEYRRIFIVYLDNKEYPIFVVGKKWGRECGEEEIIKELYFQKGLKGLHPYLEKEYTSCREENQTKLQIFDKFTDGIRVW